MGRRDREPKRMMDALKVRRRPVLLVSLPANDPELGRAAVEAGAEGLKVHINLHHAAAGAGFGSWPEERDAIERIIALGVPVGIVPGTAERMCSPNDLEQMAEVGIDFVDAYLTDMPAWMLDNRTRVHVMAAVGHSDLPPHGSPQGLELLPQVRMVEASILPHEAYGQPMRVSDVCAYAHLSSMLAAAGVSVIVPTQRAIQPSEVASLHKAGVRGILIGAIVTGKDAAGLAAATAAFRTAVEELA